jgi:hypothetical protein
MFEKNKSISATLALKENTNIEAATTYIPRIGNISRQKTIRDSGFL